MNVGKACRLSDVPLELIAASGEVGFKLLLKYVRVIDGFGMPVEWALSIVVPIFNGKGNIRNCSYY